MLKKCMLYMRGFMKLSTFVLLVILSVTVYMYQGKIREVASPWIEQSKKDGVIYYVRGIWDKVFQTQQNMGQRNQRVLEMAGGDKLITDASKKLMFKVPDAWIVRSSIGSSGNQISQTVIESSDYTERRVGTDLYYDNGAQLTIRILRGRQEAISSPNATIVSNRDIAVGDQTVSYSIVVEQNVKLGQTGVAWFEHDGNTYMVRLVFNPNTFHEGQYVFEEIVQSFEFGDMKK